jgi:hypothetical protein
MMGVYRATGAPLTARGATVLDRYHLNLAGEYRVAAELLKRGIFATITYGNRKGADIYAIGESRRMAVVEVKASNDGRFVTKFYQKYQDEAAEHPDFWVLYWLKAGAGGGFDERFFILSHDELAKAQATRNGTSDLSYVESAARVVKGVDNVLARDLAEHQDTWGKITDFMASPSSASNV